MIEIKNVSKSYGKLKVFEDFSISFEEGITTALMGASGNGKTTLLNMLAGIEKPDRGEITGAGLGKISYVFQETRLFNWLSAAMNISCVIKSKNAKEIALVWLEKTGLSDFADKYPKELSGGQIQRIAIARALAFDKEILLLDEPFKALDYELKNNMISLIKESCKGKTVIVVTHEQSEAEKIADRIITLPV